jgi:putative FmdB family regulatory protein
MPFFDYLCSACGHTDEMMHPIAKAPGEVLCPKCGAVMKRVPTLPGPPRGGDTPRFYPGRNE